MKHFLPFAVPDVGEEELHAVSQCIRSGWLTTGAVAKNFESSFRESLGGVGELHCLSLSSATAGFGIALAALGVGPGDEVISSCWTFSSPVMEILKRGARPVLVDVDRDTLNIDPHAIEKAITDRTKAIVATHFAGLACDMDAVHSIAQKHGLEVIEDAAHAFPATYKGRMVGNLGSAATVFSFYTTKTITSGEGGMLVTPDVAAARMMRAMRLHGLSKDTFDRYTLPTASWKYDVAYEGFKANMTDVAASIGLAQLRKANRFLRIRSRAAHMYRAELSSYVDVPTQPEGYGHAWHLFVIRLRGGHRGDFIEEMRKLGVGCSVHFIPIHHHSFWKGVLGDLSMLVADEEFQRVVSLPIHTRMSEHDVFRVIRAVEQIHGR